MNKIKQLLEEHENLSNELMNDENFIEESKKIFEESGLEFNREMLKSILDDVEDNLKEVQNLSDDKLSEIVGGVDIASGSMTSTKQERTKWQKAGSIAIKVTSTIVGTVLGGGLGWFLGRSSSSTYDENGKLLKKKVYEPSNLTVAMGGLTGNVLGYRLGALISRKLGWEEEIQATQP